MPDFSIFTWLNGFLLIAVAAQVAIFLKRRQIDLIEIREQQLLTFVEQGPKDLIDEEGRDLLCIAALEGYGDLCFIIMENGADPNRLYQGKPLLNIIAESGMEDTFTALVLLKQNAFVEGPKGIEMTPLQACAAYDHTDLARLLIDYGADINYQSPKTGITPLMTAVEHRSVSVGQELIKNGADLFLFDQKGRQAVDYAQKPIRLDISEHDSEPQQECADEAMEKEHIYREMIRQLHCLMEGSPYKYTPRPRRSNTSKDN